MLWAGATVRGKPSMIFSIQYSVRTSYKYATPVHHIIMTNIGAEQAATAAALQAPSVLDRRPARREPHLRRRNNNLGLQGERRQSPCTRDQFMHCPARNWLTQCFCLWWSIMPMPRWELYALLLAKMWLLYIKKVTWFYDQPLIDNGNWPIFFVVVFWWIPVGPLCGICKPYCYRFCQLVLNWQTNRQPNLFWTILSKYLKDALKKSPGSALRYSPNIVHKGMMRKIGEQSES